MKNSILLLLIVCATFIGCQQEESLIPQAEHYVQKASTTGWSTLVLPDPDNESAPWGCIGTPSNCAPLVVITGSRLIIDQMFDIVLTQQQDDIRDFFAENINQFEGIIPDAIITDVIHGHLHAASLGDKNTDNQYVYFKSLENGKIVYACPIQN